MSRELTFRSSLESLRKEAKRWLKALRADDADARARLVAALGDRTPAAPGLRDVQHALAREHGFDGWNALKDALERLRAPAPVASRDDAVLALLAAADKGNAARVAELLDAWPDIVNERAILPGHTGRRTPLHFAVNPASEETVALLLARGADPNIRDEGDDAYPLHFAAEKAHLGIVRRLVEAGADTIGTGDMHELDVIGWATVFVHEPQPELVGYLLAHGARHNILSAVAVGDAAAIRDIGRRDRAQLDRRMDRANQHRRPLHLAIVRRQPAALDALLELGADTELEDGGGLTPLDLAALLGERAMAERLLSHGARLRLPAAVALDRPDDIERALAEEPGALLPGGRWSRLIIRAAERGTGEIIERLVRAGASVHVREDHRVSIDGTHGFTALHAAAWHDNVDAARALLRLGASPAVREDRYWGTPVGWADYAGKHAVRDLLLEGAIDVFDAIYYDRLDRVREIVARDPDAIARPFGEYVTGAREGKEWLDTKWTPLAYAVANGKPEAALLLVELGADVGVRDAEGRPLDEVAERRGMPDVAQVVRGRLSSGSAPPRVPRGPEAIVADFLRMACLDWRTNGSARMYRREDAGRLLARHPEIARASIHAAVVCGDVDEVRRRLAERAEAACEIGGPCAWPPLLYLCSARLPNSQQPDEEATLTIARALLEHGADANSFYLGGNQDIHYTAFTCVMGCGEEAAFTHPHARSLVRLLLEHGADPHDSQVLYNVFADHASRPMLGDDIVWLLELMREFSVKRGHRAQWDDPEWPMFDMRGAPSLGDDVTRVPGARLLLDAAVDRELVGLARWLLEHGAGADVAAGTHPAMRKQRLIELAISPERPFEGERLEIARLLVEHGATAPPPGVFGVHDGTPMAIAATPLELAPTLLRRHPEFGKHPRFLLRAVELGNDDAVRVLLAAGVPATLTDPAHGNETALHVAARVGTERCAELLIAHGASVDAKESRYGATPLSAAAWWRQWQMVELLGRHSRDVWNLVYTGHVGRLHEVLDEQPELARVRSDSGDTPLMWLPMHETSALEAAKLLLANGADPHARNAQGLTAADIARRRGMEDVARLLE